MGFAVDQSLPEDLETHIHLTVPLGPQDVILKRRLR